MNFKLTQKELNKSIEINIDFKDEHILENSIIYSLRSLTEISERPVDIIFLLKGSKYVIDFIESRYENYINKEEKYIQLSNKIYYETI